MCDAEGVQTLQRGMNYRLRPNYSVILMSQRSTAPYRDRVYDDGVTIEYEGYLTLRRSPTSTTQNTKDQPDTLPSNKPQLIIAP